MRHTNDLFKKKFIVKSTSLLQNHWCCQNLSIIQIAGALQMSQAHLKDLYGSNDTGVYIFLKNMLLNGTPFFPNLLQFDNTSKWESSHAHDNAEPIRNILVYWELFITLFIGTRHCNLWNDDVLLRKMTFQTIYHIKTW